MIELSDKLKNENSRIFALTELLVFCDKVILNEEGGEIKSMFMMTKVGQIIEREKQEAIAEATERVTQSVSEKIARNLIRSGSTAEFVAENTGLSLEFIQGLMAAKESGTFINPEMVDEIEKANI